MTNTVVEKAADRGDYIEEKVVVDNVPDLGDKTGEMFLKNMEQAVAECRKLITQGFRLVDFWSDPDQGMQFILKKKK